MHIITRGTIIGDSLGDIKNITLSDSVKSRMTRASSEDDVIRMASHAKIAKSFEETPPYQQTLLMHPKDRPSR